MDRPYIKDVINELQTMGYDEHNAKEVLTKFYKPLKRRVGFDPNAKDFAVEINSIAKAVSRVHNPDDPDQIFIGDLRDRINKNNKKNQTVQIFVKRVSTKAAPMVGIDRHFHKGMNVIDAGKSGMKATPARKLHRSN